MAQLRKFFCFYHVIIYMFYGVFEETMPLSKILSVSIAAWQNLQRTVIIFNILFSLSEKIFIFAPRISKEKTVEK